MLPKREDRGQVALNRFSRLFTPNGKMKQVCFVIDCLIKKIVSKIKNKYHAFFILLLLVTRHSRILRLFQFGSTFPNPPPSLFLERERAPLGWNKADRVYVRHQNTCLVLSHRCSFHSVSFQKESQTTDQASIYTRQRGKR